MPWLNQHESSSHHSYQLVDICNVLKSVPHYNMGRLLQSVNNVGHVDLGELIRFYVSPLDSLDPRGSTELFMTGMLQQLLGLSSCEWTQGITLQSSMLRKETRNTTKMYYYHNEHGVTVRYLVDSEQENHIVGGDNFTTTFKDSSRPVFFYDVFNVVDYMDEMGPTTSGTTAAVVDDQLLSNPLHPSSPLAVRVLGDVTEIQTALISSYTTLFTFLDQTAWDTPAKDIPNDGFYDNPFPNVGQRLAEKEAKEELNKAFKRLFKQNVIPVEKPPPRGNGRVFLFEGQLPNSQETFKVEALIDLPDVDVPVQPQTHDLRRPDSVDMSTNFSFLSSVISFDRNRNVRSWSVFPQLYKDDVLVRISMVTVERDNCGSVMQFVHCPYLCLIFRGMPIFQQDANVKCNSTFNQHDTPTTTATMDIDNTPSGIDRSLWMD